MQSFLEGGSHFGVVLNRQWRPLLTIFLTFLCARLPTGGSRIVVREFLPREQISLAMGYVRERGW